MIDKHVVQSPANTLLMELFLVFLLNGYGQLWRKFPEIFGVSVSLFLLPMIAELVLPLIHRMSTAVSATL